MNAHIAGVPKLPGRHSRSSQQLMPFWNRGAYSGSRFDSRGALTSSEFVLKLELWTSKSFSVHWWIKRERKLSIAIRSPARGEPWFPLPGSDAALVAGPARKAHNTRKVAAEAVDLSPSQLGSSKFLARERGLCPSLIPAIEPWRCSWVFFSDSSSTDSFLPEARHRLQPTAPPCTTGDS